MGNEQLWEEVFRTHDQVEADLIHGLLSTNGFPVVIQPKGLKAMPSIFGHAAVGELILRVPPDLAQQARDLLASDIEPADAEDAQER